MEVERQVIREIVERRPPEIVNIGGRPHFLLEDTTWEEEIEVECEDSKHRTNIIAQPVRGIIRFGVGGFVPSHRCEAEDPEGIPCDSFLRVVNVVGPVVRRIVYEIP